MSYVRTLWFTTRSWEYINVLVCVCVQTWVTGRCITFISRSCLEVRGVSNWICKVKEFDLASGGWQLMSGVQLWERTQEVSQLLFRECVRMQSDIHIDRLWLRMVNYLTYNRHCDTCVTMHHYVITGSRLKRCKAGERLSHISLNFRPLCQFQN